MAAAWHDWGDGIVWIGGVVVALEAIRRGVRIPIRFFRDWRQEQADERAEARLESEAVRKHLMQKNGGSSLPDRFDTLEARFDKLEKANQRRFDDLEEIITQPKGHS